eukprot:m.160656 g.160656  ORF g.160656 m.160656 type:complete len:137 (-) comp11976_c0_seq1:179-589(-)
MSAGGAAACLMNDSCDSDESGDEDGEAVVVTIMAGPECHDHAVASEQLIRDRFREGVRVVRQRSKSGDFLVTVDGDVVHSKKAGDGYLNTSRPAIKRVVAAIEAARMWAAPAPLSMAVTTTPAHGALAMSAEASLR